MNKIQFYHIVIASLFLFAFISPLIFLHDWVSYEQQSQKHAENLLGFTMTLLMAIALTVAILQIVPLIPNNWFNKQQSKPGVEHE